MTALRPVTHRLVGDPAQVANVLRTAQQRGRLVHCGRPESLNRNRVAVTVTLLEPDPTAPRRAVRRWLKRVGVVVGALAGGVALGVLLWLLAQAVRWIHANWVPLTCLAVVTALIYGAFAASQETRR